MTSLREYGCVKVEASFIDTLLGMFDLRFAGKSAVAAGGCVRDVLRDCPPKDYDIFILDCENPDTARSEIAAKMCDDGFVPSDREHHISEPYLAGTYIIGGYPVQIMATHHKTKDELLDSFDWNVSRFAFDGISATGEPLRNIGPGCELKLHKVTFPYSTLRRGFRFSERFQMSLPIETIDKIMEEAAKLKKEVCNADAATNDQP